MSNSQVGADVAEGTLRISMGDAEAGLALLARVPPKGRDDDGMEYAAHMMSAIRAEALASLERYGDAADVVLDAVRQEGVLEADLGELVAWLAKAQRSASEIAAALSIEDLIPVLGRLLRQSPTRRGRDPRRRVGQIPRPARTARRREQDRASTADRTGAAVVVAAARARALECVPSGRHRERRVPRTAPASARRSSGLWQFRRPSGREVRP